MSCGGLVGLNRLIVAMTWVIEPRSDPRDCRLKKRECGLAADWEAATITPRLQHAALAPTQDSSITKAAPRASHFVVASKTAPRRFPLRQNRPKGFSRLDSAFVSRKTVEGSFGLGACVNQCGSKSSNVGGRGLLTVLSSRFLFFYTAEPPPSGLRRGGCVALSTGAQSKTAILPKPRGHRGDANDGARSAFLRCSKRMRVGRELLSQKNLSSRLRAPSWLSHLTHARVVEPEPRQTIVHIEVRRETSVSRLADGNSEVSDRRGHPIVFRAFSDLERLTRQVTKEGDRS